MLRYVSLAGLALVGVVPALPEIKVGVPPPEIHLDALLPSQPVANGTHLALAGKAVVLEFWAWCKPCIAEIRRYVSTSGIPDTALMKMAKLNAGVDGWMHQTYVTISAVQCWTVYWHKGQGC